MAQCLIGLGLILFTHYVIQEFLRSEERVEEFQELLKAEAIYVIVIKRRIMESTEAITISKKQLLKKDDLY